MLARADDLGPCGGSRTLRLVSEVADRLYNEGSTLDAGNRVLAVLTLIEALAGSRNVGSVLVDLAGLVES
jgi:hypothetical protein